MEPPIWLTLIAVLLVAIPFGLMAYLLNRLMNQK